VSFTLLGGSAHFIGFGGASSFFYAFFATFFFDFFSSSGFSINLPNSILGKPVPGGLIYSTSGL
jgi:hypothetical protein